MARPVSVPPRIGKEERKTEKKKARKNAGIIKHSNGKKEGTHHKKGLAVLHNCDKTRPVQVAPLHNPHPPRYQEIR